MAPAMSHVVGMPMVEGKAKPVRGVVERHDDPRSAVDAATLAPPRRGPAHRGVEGISTSPRCTTQPSLVAGAALGAERRRWCPCGTVRRPWDTRIEAAGFRRRSAFRPGAGWLTRLRQLAHHPDGVAKGRRPRPNVENCMWRVAFPPCRMSSAPDRTPLEPRAASTRGLRVPLTSRLSAHAGLLADTRPRLVGVAGSTNSIEEVASLHVGSTAHM